MDTKLILVRHAQAEGNFTREFHGWTDSDITEFGHKQAELTAQRLKDEPIDVLYSSSMLRAMETASYISKIKNLPIIRTDKLKEINGGDWEKVRFDQLAVLFPNEFHTWENEPHIHIMPNGESMEEFQSRLIPEIEYIIAQNRGKNVCVVTHGTAIKALMCYFRGLKLENMRVIAWYDNTSITIIEHSHENGYKVLSEGDNTHLGEEYSTLLNQDWWADYLKKIEELKNSKE